MNQKLKEARISKQLTQSEMAKMLGYKSKSGYNMIETGKNNPPLQVAIKISEIVEKPISELFEGLTEQAASSA